MTDIVTQPLPLEALPSAPSQAADSAGSLFDLRGIDHENAAVHARFAQVEAAKWPGPPPAASPARLERVAVLGAGSVGCGISMALVEAGLAVTMIDRDPASVQRALVRIRDHYQHAIVRERLRPQAMSERLSRVRSGAGVHDAAEVDLVIDATVDDLAAKEALLARVEAIVRPNTVLASHSGGLDVGFWAAALRRPQQALGLHFFAPAQSSRVVEVVYGPRTANEVVQALMVLAVRLGKTPVLTRSQPGFIGQALHREFLQEAHALVEDGAEPIEVDQALRAVGYAAGVFELHDLAGNDVVARARTAHAAGRAAGLRQCTLVQRLVDAGRLGRHCGRGWYRYVDGRPQMDPELLPLLQASAQAEGRTRRPVGREEILQRCLLRVVNEAAGLLERGIAARPSDIDLVALHGLGFPAGQGGPLFMADRIGLPRVLAAVEALHAQAGDAWEPAGLLRQLADAGRSFAQWQAAR